MMLNDDALLKLGLVWCVDGKGYEPMKGGPWAEDSGGGPRRENECRRLHSCADMTEVKYV